MEQADENNKQSNKIIQYFENGNASSKRSNSLLKMKRMVDKNIKSSASIRKFSGKKRISEMQQYFQQKQIEDNDKKRKYKETIQHTPIKEVPLNPESPGSNVVYKNVLQVHIPDNNAKSPIKGMILDDELDPRNRRKSTSIVIEDSPPPKSILKKNPVHSPREVVTSNKTIKSLFKQKKDSLAVHPGASFGMESKVGKKQSKKNIYETCAVSTLEFSTEDADQENSKKSLQTENDPHVVGLKSSQEEDRVDDSPRINTSQDVGKNQIELGHSQQVENSQNEFGHLKSICFSTEEYVTGLGVTKDGHYVVAALSNGSVRLYDMQSNIPEDRLGYLLGHLDEESNSAMPPSLVKVHVTQDGYYCFVGCRKGPRIIMCIDLNAFSRYKDQSSGELKKYFCADAKLRGFGDVIDDYDTTNVSARKTYKLLTGLGVGNLRLWQFQEPTESETLGRWDMLHTFSTNGATVYIANFLGAGSTFVSRSDDKDMRRCTITKDLASGLTVPVWHALKDTKEISYASGKFGYGVTSQDDLYRVDLTEDKPEKKFYHVFPMEESSGMGRGTKDSIEMITATSDGRFMFGTSSSGGLFYYDQDQSEAKGPTLQYLRKLNVDNMHKTFKAQILVSRSCIEQRHANAPVFYFAPNIDDAEQGCVCVAPISDLIANNKATGSNLVETCWVCRQFQHDIWPNEDQTPAPAPTPKSINTGKKVAASTSKSPTRVVEPMVDGYDTTLAEVLSMRKRVQELEKDAAIRLKAEFALRKSWNVRAKNEKALNDSLEKAQYQVQILEAKCTSLQLKQKDAIHIKDLESELQQVRNEYLSLLSGGSKTMERIQIRKIRASLMEALANNHQIEIYREKCDKDNSIHECIICRDKPSNVAVYPCGHVCFCEEDAKLYKNSTITSHPITGTKSKGRPCPICQREILSLLTVVYP